MNSISTFLIATALVITGCGSPAMENKKTDTSSTSTENNVDTGSISSSENESNDNTTENAGKWETVDGVKIRKNTTLQKEMEGKTYVLFENYNSGGGSGGYNSERRMNLCAGGEITTYEQSHTSIYIEGSDASSASEDSDSGTWQIYEDESGNLFMKIKMKKSGEGFVNFQLKDGKLIMGGQAYSIGKGKC
jgi:hypothetical protein